MEDLKIDQPRDLCLYMHDEKYFLLIDSCIRYFMKTYTGYKTITLEPSFYPDSFYIGTCDNYAHAFAYWRR